MNGQQGIFSLGHSLHNHCIIHLHILIHAITHFTHIFFSKSWKHRGDAILFSLKLDKLLILCFGLVVMICSMYSSGLRDSRDRAITDDQVQDYYLYTLFVFLSFSLVRSFLIWQHLLLEEACKCEPLNQRNFTMKTFVIPVSNSSYDNYAIYLEVDKCFRRKTSL